MYIARVFVQSKALPSQTVSSLLGGLLCAWRMNGQLQIQNRSWGIYAQDGIYSVEVLIPAIDALSTVHNSIYADKRLTEFQENGLPLPKIEILGREIECLAECTCVNRSAYILFNTYLSLESVVRCADCFNPIPLYTLPYIGSDEHYEIVNWAHAYECCDALQMGCVVLERSCMREMFDVHSNLSRTGLSISQQLAEQAGIPVYYYLYKHNGRSLRQETARKCPSCGEDWLLSEAWHDMFDFRCDQCHLLSNIAYSVRN